MSKESRDKIAFDVETSRVLQILSSEIYDSPKAFLRENVQNAYDAILMRCTAEGVGFEAREIEITVERSRLTVSDDGIGMTERVLTENFWRAGSSGKRTELAQCSGVIGTFGIGAMANFGVCTSLRVETRHIESDVTLVTAVRRDDLRIAQDCVDLERRVDSRESGTKIVADLDPDQYIDVASATKYLRQYVRFLPVPVTVNGDRISGESFGDALAGGTAGFERVSSRHVSDGRFAGLLEVSANSQGRLRVCLSKISLNGAEIDGAMFLVQKGGVIHGFRNLFGLAPVPVSGHYGLSGFVNLDVLCPTAGREALSRGSIQHVGKLIELIEREATVDFAETEGADINQQFQQYILAKGLTKLARRVRISVLPTNRMIQLGEVKAFEAGKQRHYYAGQDKTILKQFAGERVNLFHVSATNPRRKLQMRFLAKVAKLEGVPERTIVENIPATALTIEEAMFLVRLKSILLDDYLMANIDVGFANISHGVDFHVRKMGKGLEVAIARGISSVKTVVECYANARDVFDGFAKDFVREYIYPHVKEYVPSSMRQGRDELYRRLKENRELFRLKESDYGAIEPLLADYLAGKSDLSEVIRASRSRARVQRQRVSRAQVGRVEEELPSIIGDRAKRPRQDVYEPEPPLVRNGRTEMKVLTVARRHERLNNFRMFLALSDRMVKREGEFLHWPHSTKLIWGAHRIIYIFADATGELSLYYDIRLEAPLDTGDTGGGAFPTTTVVTDNRIYVPVPENLEAAFRITDGSKEFYVRFDTIP